MRVQRDRKRHCRNMGQPASIQQRMKTNPNARVGRWCCVRVVQAMFALRCAYVNGFAALSSEIIATLGLETSPTLCSWDCFADLC
jgi:hypothetical protein